MANLEHIEIVKQGASAIEAWKKLNPSQQLDLSAANLSNTELHGANLSAADLTGANLRRAHLCRADLSEAKLIRAELHSTHFLKANLRFADLTSAILMGAIGIRADLSGANLGKIWMHITSLADATLNGADLRDAVLMESNLSGATLCGADLRGLIVRGVELGDADLSECTCGGLVEGWTAFVDVDLSHVKGLESVRHDGPTSIGVDTLLRSKGKIPEVFLRSAGVPKEVVKYLRALEFYTCFISFTEADDAFSQRLYNDLRAAGVSCWRWKEDAKGGRPLDSEVDSAIRLHDKLVVILSAASLRSEPVIREIDRALRKEQREKKDVLFPVRLDDAVFTWDHYLQADVVRKVIGDFREPAKYDAALERLIADLQAERRPQSAP